jgi:hypothetical protein
MKAFDFEIPFVMSDSYSVVNIHKAMLFQTLPFFGVLWIKEPVKPRIMTTWDVSVVLTFVFTLYPLSELSLTPAPNGFEVDAPRNERAENFEISIPDKNKTCFSHLATRSYCFKRLERNKIYIFIMIVLFDPESVTITGYVDLLDINVNSNL